MPAYDDVIKAVLLAVTRMGLPEVALSPENIAALTNQIESVHKPVLPSAGETCVVSTNFKTAALFFDRVWTAPDEAPEEIRFFGASANEVALKVYTSLCELGGNSEAKKAFFDACRQAKLFDITNFKGGDPLLGAHRLVQNVIQTGCSIPCSIMLSSSAQTDEIFPPGDYACLATAISDVVAVNEDAIEWDQVIEFRRDETSKKDLRRIRHWYNREFSQMPLSQLSDEISIRLDNYERAIRKHGLATTAGILSDVLNPTFLAGSGALVAGIGHALGGEAAGLAVGAVTVGGSILSIARKYIDREDAKYGQGSEVAFVHELKKLSK